jgi:DNA-cytosine methyltransferase
MNVLSLFDGMSCGQIALNKLGIEYDRYFACEIDKFAMQVTQHNYPLTEQLGSVTDLDTSELPKIDLLIGGSPCQSFSNLGNGKGFDGKSSLFWEYVRILKETKPKYFLLENVVMKKEWQAIITEAMGVEPIKMNSRNVSAQNRPRLFWTNIPITQPEDLKIFVKDIVDTEVEDKYYLSDLAIAKVQRSKFGREYATLDTEKVRTLTAGYYKIPGDGVYFQDHKGKRRYTPTECERLQTVPEGYTEICSNSQRWKMLGNGWTVDLIAHIFKNIK